MRAQLDKFEQGPIRPPSEANSLLLRLTRNCPWNRCLFCPVYKGEKFSRRSLEEIRGDIETISLAVDKIKELSQAKGLQGEVNDRLAAFIRSDYPDLFQVAFWLYHGGKTVFLQDGDSLLLPVKEIIEVLELVKEKFPSVERVTTYARSRTILRRSVEELASFKEAGLNRIHIGLESGSDAVLEFMQKGVTGEMHIEAGQRVRQAGISLSEYVILGLGGADMWREHALETARVLNQIDPDFIRVRTLAVPSFSPLFKKMQEGEFSLINDDQIINEELLLIENLTGIESRFYSDHNLNLLEEVNGKLPEEKQKLLGIINSYLQLPDLVREHFRLGKRAGYYRVLADLNNSSLSEPVGQLYQQLQNRGFTVDSFIREQMLTLI